MGRFPSSRQVGDLLASGVHIEPEQEELLDAPGGRPMVAVWSVPDPTAEDNMAYWINGRPIVLPVVIRNCTPDEVWTKNRSLNDVLKADGVLTFKDPLLVGELVDDGQFQTMNHWIADSHYARQTFDLWPIDEREVAIFEAASAEALANSGYLELVDYLAWEDGNDFPEAEEQVEHVHSRVLDEYGQLKAYDEFLFEVVLPKEQRYAWEKLQDLSQQGWTSYGMALPKDQRHSFFRKSGDCPWF